MNSTYLFREFCHYFPPLIPVINNFKCYLIKAHDKKIHEKFLKNCMKEHVLPVSLLPRRLAMTLMMSLRRKRLATHHFITLQFSFVLLVEKFLYYIFDIHGEVNFFLIYIYSLGSGDTSRVKAGGHVCQIRNLCSSKILQNNNLSRKKIKYIIEIYFIK